MSWRYVSLRRKSLRKNASLLIASFWCRIAWLRLSTVWRESSTREFGNKFFTSSSVSWWDLVFDFSPVVVLGGDFFGFRLVIVCGLVEDFFSVSSELTENVEFVRVKLADEPVTIEPFDFNFNRADGKFFATVDLDEIDETFDGCERRTRGGVSVEVRIISRPRDEIATVTFNDFCSDLLCCWQIDCRSSDFFIKSDASFGFLDVVMGRNVLCSAFFTSLGELSCGFLNILVLTCRFFDILANSSSIFFFSTAKARSFDIPRPNATGLWLVFRSGIFFRATGLVDVARHEIRFELFKSSLLVDVIELEIVAGPADLDRFTSDFLVLDVVDDIRKLIESCFEQLFDLVDETGDVDAFKCEPSFNVELVRDDLRLGGGGGTTGTNDFTVLGNGPNMSKGREMFVIG